MATVCDHHKARGEFKEAANEVQLLRKPGMNPEHFDVCDECITSLGLFFRGKLVLINIHGAPKE